VTPTTTPTRMTAWLEQAWMVRYLDRQLASEEADWFEAYALDKPELLAMIEADTRLRDALAADASIRHMERSVDRGGRQGGATGDAPCGVNEPTPLAYARDKLEAREKTETEVRTAHRRPAPAWLAMAATLVLGLGLGWIGTRSFLPGDTVPELVASPTRIVYDTMRGEPTPPRVEHADSKSPYVFVEVAAPPGAENITLKMGDAPEQPVSTSPDGFVSFLVLRATIKTGDKAQIAYVLAGHQTLSDIRLDAHAISAEPTRH
jgi:hypothetical protein